MIFSFWKAGGGWAAPLVAATIIALVGGVEVSVQRHLVQAVRHEVLTQHELEDRLAGAASAGLPSCPSEVSYAYSLPSSVSIDRLVQALQGSAKAFSVALVSVSSEPRGSVLRALPSVEVNVALHGAYGGVKSTLSEAMSRFPSAALEHLRFKRDTGNGPTNEDVSVQFLLPLRPATPPPSCQTAKPFVHFDETSIGGAPR